MHTAAPCRRRRERGARLRELGQQREERDALSRECAALKRKRGVFDSAEDEHCGERPVKRLAGAGANVVPQRNASGLPAGLAALMAGPVPVDVLDMCESLTRRSGPADLMR
ncbi:hypothetical protein EWM64_g80 [Hericium alpestre]|uniref:Uncharacterized protein n=1 Tax=Hericium alpestre TaxID=135208 RepID=A0A4Z0ABF3_9AGAM|nr:hypothetical protein EWM64_g80 [Hericium alpestre]